MPRLDADTTWPPAVGERFPITNPKMPMDSGLHVGHATRVAKDQVMIIWTNQRHDNNVPMNRIRQETINNRLYYTLMDPPPEETEMPQVRYYEKIGIKALNISIGDYLIMEHTVFHVDTIHRAENKITVSYGDWAITIPNNSFYTVFRSIPADIMSPSPSKDQQRDEFLLEFQRADTHYARGSLIWDTFHRD